MVPVISDAQTQARFLQKIHPTQECWMWIAGKLSSGYGVFFHKGKSVKAHRFSWEMFEGKIPKDKIVCHSCDTPACVNPAHLWLGDARENVKDRDTKHRQAVGIHHGSKTKPERIPRGERHGSRLHPEKIYRGDEHWTRKKPWLLARGNYNGARLHPERLARGDRSGARLHPERVPRGERVNTAILREDQVLEIRQLAEAGHPHTRIAKRFAVQSAAVWKIVHRYTWKHI